MLKNSCMHSTSRRDKQMVTKPVQIYLLEVQKTYDF